MKKSRSTRSHFTHAQICSRALNQVPMRAKQPASIRTYSLWKGDIFPFDRFTGYKKSNQNQFGRVLPFVFALTYYKIYLLFSSLADFDSFSWRVHLSYGVCRLRARVLRKTLSSLLKQWRPRPQGTTPTKNWIYNLPWNFLNCLDLFRVSGCLSVSELSQGKNKMLLCEQSLLRSSKMKIRNISRRRKLSLKYAELCHFMLLESLSKPRRQRQQDRR